jgi:hypothetical protein
MLLVQISVSLSLLVQIGSAKYHKAYGSAQQLGTSSSSQDFPADLITMILTELDCAVNGGEMRRVAITHEVLHQLRAGLLMMNGKSSTLLLRAMGGSHYEI